MSAGTEKKLRFEASYFLDKQLNNDFIMHKLLFIFIVIFDHPSGINQNMSLIDSCRFH